MFFSRKKRLDVIYEEAAEFLRRCYNTIESDIEKRQTKSRNNEELNIRGSDIRFSLDFSIKNSESRYSLRFDIKKELEKDTAHEETDVRYFKDIESDKVPSVQYSFDDWLEPTFVEKLTELMNEKHMSDIEVYKAAGMDRRLYSRIMSDKKTHPSKDTAILFCFALHLTLEQTEDLLRRAGYALSRSIRRDVLLEYFLVSEHWDISEINTLLTRFHEKVLGR